jgi:membrane protein YdbS with pleckstrin-like domain
MYYLWINEAQTGPYTMHQLQEMWNAGQITAMTPYWQEGQSDWLLLNTIIAQLEPGVAHPVSEITETVYIPQFEQKILRKMSSQAAVPAHPDATPPVESSVVEKMFWTGHPTLWKWFWHLLAGLIVLGILEAAAFFYHFPIGMILAPILVALVTLVPVVVARNSTRYAVTNQRVSLETGIFTKTSRELRLQDIRSIAAKRNFLGFGDIEFSSAASDDAEVIFHAVPNVEAVRELVKKLQV